MSKHADVRIENPTMPAGGWGSVLAAISAPTALAVQVADRAGLTLAGFVRGGRHVLYSHPQRLAPQASEAPG